jgi:hypothetical protein
MVPKTSIKIPASHQKIMQLPLLVTSPVDVGRLLRELEVVDDKFLQLGLRASAASMAIGDQDDPAPSSKESTGPAEHPKGTSTKLPRISRLLDQTIQLNQLNLLQTADRATLQQFLTAVQQQSPLLHISFSSDPAPAFVEKLMAWLRQEIHPSVLLIIGLQPTIGAGCILRGTNKQFDLSLRQDFLGKRQLLLETLLTPPAVSVVATTETAGVTS